MNKLHNMSVPPMSKYQHQIVSPDTLVVLDLYDLLWAKIFEREIIVTTKGDELNEALKIYLSQNEKWYEKVKPIDKYCILYRYNSRHKYDFKIEMCDDINLCIYILSKSVNGFYIPTREMYVNNINITNKYCICKSDLQ